MTMCAVGGCWERFGLVLLGASIHPAWHAGTLPVLEQRTFKWSRFGVLPFFRFYLPVERETRYRMAKEQQEDRAGALALGLGNWRCPLPNCLKHSVPG